MSVFACVSPSYSHTNTCQASSTHTCVQCSLWSGLKGFSDSALKGLKGHWNLVHQWPFVWLTWDMLQLVMRCLVLRCFLNGEIIPLCCLVFLYILTSFTWLSFFQLLKITIPSCVSFVLSQFSISFILFLSSTTYSFCFCLFVWRFLLPRIISALLS